MRPTATCPVRPEVVEEVTVRLGAGLVLGAGALVLATRSPGLGALLALDFTLRALGHARWSPVARLAIALRSLVQAAPRPVNAGPKQFAAGVGAAFALGISLALAAGHPWLALSLGGTLLLCATLEAVAGLCVGCRVYALLRLLWPAPGRRAPQADLLS